MIIFKIWPVWLPSLRYHDQYLMSSMISDGVDTFFFQPKYTPKEYEKFISIPDENYVDGKCFYFEFINILGKPLPIKPLTFIKQLNSLCPDIVHIFGISNFTTIFTLICIFLSTSKPKVVFNDHSDPNNRKSGFIAYFYRSFFKLVYKILINKKSPIVVPDLATKNELVEKYGPSISSSIRLIPLGYDDTIFRFKNNLRSKKLPLKIGFAGKINPKKNIEMLLNAISKLPVQDVEAHIVGINNFDSLSHYENALVSESMPNVTFYEFIRNPQNLAKFYSSMDLMVFPGSISITTFEASACGTPVALFETYEGLEHRVADGKGVLFSNDEELHSSIVDFIKKKNNTFIDHSKIAESASFFAWSSIKRDYYNVYEFNL